MSSPTEADIRVSVVIAASGAPELLERCIASLQEQSDVVGIEVIVVSNYSAGAIAAHIESIPYANYVPMAAGTTVPRLRACGIQQARGSVVVLSEDNCMFDPCWYVNLREAHLRLPHVAIGGAVDNSSESRVTNWAVYFYEYGRFMSPNRAGEVDALPGNHLSYKRAVLDELREHYSDGFYETVFHQKLQDLGQTLYMEPSAIVYHIRNYAAADVLRQCYHHGRTFAGMRVEGGSLGRRAVLGVGSLLLPWLLTGRIVRRVLGKKRHQWELLKALPLLFVFMTSWAYGEMCGYLGGPGESAGKWT